MMSFRDGMNANSITSYRKIYIGCSSLPLNRAVSLRASEVSQTLRQYKQSRANERRQIQRKKRQLVEMYRENKDMFNRKHALKNRHPGACRRDLRLYSNTTSRMKKSQNVVKEFKYGKKIFSRDENYGILMGKPNNAICLDYDIYDPNCARNKSTRSSILRKCGDDVYISRTPSGGYHAVFRYEARFDTWKNATKINVQGYTNHRRVHLWKRM
ncbi:unnamed protein product [Bathycoccus prasinos]